MNRLPVSGMVRYRNAGTKRSATSDISVSAAIAMPQPKENRAQRIQPPRSSKGSLIGSIAPSSTSGT